MDRPVLVLFVGSNDKRGVVDEFGANHDQFDTVVEATASDALERLEHDAPEIDCIVSRYDLSGMDGVDLLKSVRETYPDLPYILFTDAGNENVASDAISAGVTDYIQEGRTEDAGETLAERIESTVDVTRTAKESKRRLEELAESTTDCLWIFSRDWNELHFISGYEEIWHRPAEQLATNPQDFLNAVHPADRDRVEEGMERLSKGTSLDTEYRIVRGDGETSWVWVKGEPVYDDVGNVVRVAGFTRDVTERKERERRYETLVENLPGIVYRAAMEPGWPMTFVHGDCEPLTGYTAEELRDDIDFGADLIHPDDREDVYETVRDAVDVGESFEFTYRIITKDGDTRWVWERGREVEDGVVEGLLTDITARVTQKQELELRNQAIREAPVGILLTDPGQDDNPIVFANKKFLSLTGYTEEEVLGRNCRFLQGAQTSDDAVKQMREAVDNQEPVTVELRNYRKDGSMFWNRVSIAPVRDETGEVVNYVGFQEDVTERKQRQEQLKVLSRVLRHNLRNNQNAIRGWAEAVQSKSEPALAKYAERIIDNTDQMITIAEKERVITEILTEKPRRRCIELDSLLRNVLQRLETEFPHAEFTLECPERTRILASTRIEIALEELLTNAVIHNDSTTSTVSVSVTLRGESVDLRVADNGPLIPEMEYPRLMHDREETPVFHHGGLGLWLVNLVVTRSGGTLSFEENEPRGNIVRITLPAGD